MRGTAFKKKKKKKNMRGTCVIIGEGIYAILEA
jgi:hypothetical protein